MNSSRNSQKNGQKMVKKLQQKIFQKITQKNAQKIGEVHEIQMDFLLSCYKWSLEIISHCFITD